MGNSQTSNRKITVVNDEVAGVIKISDSVVRRLKGELKQGRDETKAPSQPAVYQNDNSNDVAKPSPQAASSSALPPVTAPVITVKESNAYGNIMEEAHLTALKIRQEKEAELRRVEEHWRNQLLNLTNHYNELSQLTEAEYRAAIHDVEIAFAKTSFSNVCSDQKERVLKCYKEHKDRPLECAGEVKEFAACVQKFRLENLDKQTR